MRYRKKISLKCPVCLKKRIVRADGVGKLCRSCRAKDNSKKRKHKDISGLEFGKLTAINISHKLGRIYYWNCLCACGNKVIIAGYRLRHGTTKSCGCLAKSQNGLSTSSSYRSWHSMIQRCYDNKVAHYQRYGAKGIKVCDRWKNSFLSFLEDMGERPIGKTLDRIDSSGDYTKENCRWATLREQNNNRLNNHYLEAFGKKQSLTNWAIEVGINWSTILRRITAGWTIEDALTRKVDKCQKKQKLRLKKKYIAF